VLIALADMPRVTATQVYHLFDAADGPDAIVASSNGEHPTPPVLFGSDQFEALLQIEGDAGARDMVMSGKHVVATPAELVDIDAPEALEKLREQFEWRR
jgi:molybdenum cofactor cytidylyltransferase